MSRPNYGAARDTRVHTVCVPRGPLIESPEDLEQYLGERTRRLGIWRSGQDAALETLAWLDRQPLVERYELGNNIGNMAAAAMLSGKHHNQVAVASSWVPSYMSGPARINRSIEQDRQALWRSAIAVFTIRDLLAEHRAGYRGFVPGRGLIKLPYEGNNAIDALDRFLDLTETLNEMDRPPISRDEKLTDWLDRRERGPWSELPEWARNRFRRAANHAVDGYELDLPLSVVVGEFSLADVDRYWRELIAYAMYGQSVVGRRSLNRPPTIQGFKREHFADLIARPAGIAPGPSLAITDRLTMDTARCSDPALTPLVPLRDKLFPMVSLIMPGSPQRNMLSALQSDPGSFGRAGQLLGAAGERTTLGTLERLHSRTLKASHVPARRTDGSKAGDLDVVVIDPDLKVGAIFEIKWNIAADGNHEVYRSEQAALQKRAQVLRLRSELDSGAASIAWPPSWPDLDDYRWRWFVLSRDVLVSSDIAGEGVTVRSHQLINRMVPSGATVGKLIELLDDPPIPPEAFSETRWNRIRFGDLRIEVESIVA